MPDTHDYPVHPWHQTHWKRFLKSLQQDHLAHAILLCGQEHTGKLDFAAIMAKTLLCERPTEQGPCQQCQSCKTYDAGSNPDFMRIALLDDKQQIGVDQIRTMSAFLTLSRSFKGERVALIESAERMNQNAANSLLKSLEEPAEHSIILLVSSQPSSLLPTIRSRCRIEHLGSPNRHDAIYWLKKHTGLDSHFEEELDIAQGRPLQAIQIDEENIQERRNFQSDLKHIVELQAAITVTAKKWDKKDLSQLLDWQLNWVADLIKLNQQATVEPYKLKQNHAFYESMNSHLDTRRYWTLYDALISQKPLVHTSVNPLILTENMLMSWLEIKK